MIIYFCTLVFFIYYKNAQKYFIIFIFDGIDFVAVQPWSWQTCATGPYGITSCSGQKDGNYNTCTSCSSFITCVGGASIRTASCSSLFLDSNLKGCVSPNITQTCFDIATGTGFPFTYPLPGSMCKSFLLGKFTGSVYCFLH